MEVITDGGDGYFNKIGPILKQRFLEQGLLIRPLGNTVYLMLPYCVTEAELIDIYQKMVIVFESL